MTWINGLATGALLLTVASAAPEKREWHPTVKNSQILGNMADPSLNRDSCGSCRMGGRAFWTCRDSQPYDGNHNPTLPVWSSSASWSNLDNTPPDLFMYGGGSAGHQTPYFPYTATGECGENSAGACPDGTRYALWPDSPPAVTSDDGHTVTAYTWISKQHIRGLETVDKDPATSLYKMTYEHGAADRDALPQVQLVNENFWLYNGIPYGAYGNVVKDGTLYLYGKPSNGKVALAKVPVGSVEDHSAYEFWVNGSWTRSLPGKDDQGINIDNAGAGGQGTYYFSNYWNKYVWIGQPGISVAANFHVTTADSPTGPWEKPVLFYEGQSGTFDLGAYSLQAHPGLSHTGTDKNEIYITYTKNDLINNLNVYTTPLIYIEWN